MTISRATSLAGLTAVLLAALTGCSAGSGDAGSTGAAGSGGVTPSVRATAPARSAAPVAARPSATGPAQPTLPPGDPGADAPGVEDPNADANEPAPPTSTAPAARRHVPAAALLDAATVGSLTGTSWTASRTPADACDAPRATGAVAVRDRAMTGPGGRLTESVATYAHPAAATAAVRELARRLSGCAGASPSDPRVGDASVQATVASSDGTSSVVTAIAADGVLAVLAGRGAVAGEASWPSLTDLALGNTCVATAAGCH